VRYERCARLAPLVRVSLARKGECLADPVEIDGADRVVGVLRDDSEQVGEQLLLVWQEVKVGPRGRGRSRGSLANADPDVGVGRQVAGRAAGVEDGLAGARVLVAAV
jgi:hypothetical protein